MAERPIQFSGSLVKALLAGTKTQTRRIISPQPADICTLATWRNQKADPRMADPPNDMPRFLDEEGHAFGRWSPYGRAGDRLWVKETWMELYDAGDGSLTCLPPTSDDSRQALRRAKYRADGQNPKNFAASWKSPRFMPRWASRITLEVTEVRAERLQSISEQDAKAEGVTTDAQQGKLNGKPATLYPMTHRQAFIWLWDAINGAKAPWSSNPFCWVISFRRVEARDNG